MIIIKEVKRHYSRPTFFEMILPRKCVSCGSRIGGGAESKSLCNECYSVFLTELGGKCQGCGREYAFCECAPKSFHPDQTVYVLPYDLNNSVTRKIILCCKNRNIKRVFGELAELVTEAAEKRGLIDGDEIITYVPRTALKETMYGVDQAKELAYAISKLTSLPLIPTAIRTGEGKGRKLMGRKERMSSDASLMLISGIENAICGKKIILVDDVITTGSTVNAYTALLKNAGAERVVCLAVAKNINEYAYISEAAEKRSADGLQPV